MVSGKLIQGSATALYHTRTHDNLGEIVHGLKNYMSILLLCVENLQIHPDHPLPNQHQAEDLENAIHEMNCLVEKLVVYSESKVTQKGDGYFKKLTVALGMQNKRCLR